MTKKLYDVIRYWTYHKSIKNFLLLYKYGFHYNKLWTRPLWRIYRIIRNTITKRYMEIANDKQLQEKFKD